MTTIESINKAIREATADKQYPLYSMGCEEAAIFMNMLYKTDLNTIFHTIGMIYKFGYAKGKRAEKALIKHSSK